MNSQSKNPDDIVITLAIRTPLTKARKGGFKDTSLEYLVYALLAQVRERCGIDPGLVEDICLGNVSLPLRAYGAFYNRQRDRQSNVSAPNLGL